MQSTISDKYKNKLIDRLKSKEYRDAYVESHINNGVSFQIKTMRDKRQLKQNDLACLTGMKQEAISRLENPNYGSFTLKTLKKIAKAFDVALIIRFVPFGDLVKWDLSLSDESLDVCSYNDDSYLHEEVIGATGKTFREIDKTQITVDNTVIDLDEYRSRVSTYSAKQTIYSSTSDSKERIL